MVFTFLIGICIGSFLNVVVYRLPLNINMAKGRSFCPKCKTTLQPLDLVPIFSWVFLGAKCRYCKEKIAFQYPFVELLTGIFFVLFYLKYGFTIDFFRIIFLVSLLIVISIIDIKEQYIYDITIIIGVICTGILLVGDALLNNDVIVGYIISAVVTGLIYYILHFVTKKMYGDEVFGLGDVFLGILIGINTPVNLLYYTICLPFIVGLVVIIFVKIKSIFMKTNFESRVPFGPFMAASCIILLFFDKYFEHLLF
ncbi:MAG: prepilin peptidase [Lachnospirales bacterium]